MIFSEHWFARLIIVTSAVALALIFLFSAIVFLPSSGPNIKNASVVFSNVKFTAEVAESPSARMKGLSGRDLIPEFGGMLFKFLEPGIYSFWMKDMRFSIDIIWLSKGQIVYLVKDAEFPKSGTPDVGIRIFTPNVDADAVLEVRAGMAGRYDIKIGDKVDVTVK
ncbi:MAG: DUF192 domain-containing protein [bacterium]|nr:DUF192 domain-containing protein [bacterium]